MEDLILVEACGPSSTPYDLFQKILWSTEKVICFKLYIPICIIAVPVCKHNESVCGVKTADEFYNPKKKEEPYFDRNWFLPLMGADLVDCNCQICFSFAGDPSLPVTLCCHENVLGVLILYYMIVLGVAPMCSCFRGGL